MKIYLKEPSLEEYWYKQKVLSDPLAMEYNAGWDVSYDGYHYDTGCIDFEKEKWAKDFERRNSPNNYFAYIVREEDNEFVGYVNFHLNEKENRYYCGVLVEPCYKGKGYGSEALKQLCSIAFNDYNVDSLYDNFEEERNSSIIFTNLGFKKIGEYNAKKFHKDIKIIEICLKKEEFLKISKKNKNEGITQNYELNDVKNNYNLEANVQIYSKSIEEVGLWKSEEIIFNKYINRNHKILDLGCGTGRTTINLFKNGFQNIIGLDISDELINAGNNYCKGNNINLNLLVGDATNLKYEDSSFDVAIFSYNGMMCIPGHKNRANVLKEVHRVLKPNGIYIFTAHNRDDSGIHNKEWEEEKLLWEKGIQDAKLEMFGDKYPTDVTGETIFIHFSNIKEMEDLVKSIGFEVIEYVKSTDIALENKKTREFAGPTVFWIVRKK